MEQHAPQFIFHTPEELPPVEDAPKTPKKAAENAPAPEALADLKKETMEQMRALGEKTGVPTDFGALKDDIGTVVRTIVFYFKQFNKVLGGDGALDNVSALMAPLGVKPSTVAEVVKADKKGESEKPAADAKGPRGEKKDFHDPESLKAAGSAKENAAPYRAMIREACADKERNRYGIKEAAVIALISTETADWDPNAKNPKSSALGLSQILDDTFQEYQTMTNEPNARREDPEDAIRATVWYMNRVIDIVKAKAPQEEKYWIAPDDTENVRLAYHIGPGDYVKMRRQEDDPNINARILASLKNTARGEAKRTAQVAAAFDALEKNPERFAMRFDSPPIAGMDAESFFVTSDFGPRKGPKSGKEEKHGGIDLRGSEGTPLLAVKTARVKKSEFQQGGAGNYITLELENGFTVQYFHLQKPASLADGTLLKAGDIVSAGEEIGKIGHTGETTGPHLHLGLLNPQGRAVDPNQYLAALAKPRAAESAKA